VQFVRFVAVILTIFTPVVLLFTSPNVFWFLFAFWITCFLLVLLIVFIRYF
jgi:hypothetical protein